MARRELSSTLKNLKVRKTRNGRTHIFLLHRSIWNVSDIYLRLFVENFLIIVWFQYGFSMLFLGWIVHAKGSSERGENQERR